MKGQSRFFLTIAWNFKIKRFWHKLFASLKRKILTNESSLLQTFLLWVLYLGCGRNSRQKAGGERGALDKKLFLLQIVRYKVASVNKTVQTYQQGDFSARHVTSLQTTLQGANVRERAHTTSPSPLQHTTNSPQMYICMQSQDVPAGAVWICGETVQVPSSPVCGIWKEANRGSFIYLPPVPRQKLDF